MQVSTEARTCAAVGATAVLLYAALMALNAARASGGDVRIFYNVGDVIPIPAYVHAQGFPIRRDNVGYDGQFYLHIASDPLLLRGQLLSNIDSPVHRYRRVGLPLLAAATCGFQGAPCVVWSIPVLLFFALGLGAAFAARFVTDLGRSPWWGLAWAALPGISMGLPRYLPDVLSTSLCMIALHACTKRRHGAAAALFVVAALTRETALLVALAAAASTAWSERERARAALLVATPALLLGAWFIYLRLRLGTITDEAAVQFSWPGHGVWSALERPLFGGREAWVRARALGDLLSVTSFLGAAVVCVRAWSKRPRGLLELMGVLYVALGLLAGPKVWVSATSSTRAFDGVQVACLLLALTPLAGEPAIHKRWLLWPALAAMPGFIPLVSLTLFPPS